MQTPEQRRAYNLKYQTKPSMCACGKLGVRYKDHDWVCQRCLNIEDRLYGQGIPVRRHEQFLAGKLK
jgi:hypothetical protein